MDDKQALVKLHLALGDLSLEKMIEISQKDLDVNDKIDIATAAHKFYQEYFGDCLTRFILAEMKNMVENAQTNEDLQFFRGKISAFSELDSWFKLQNGVWLQTIESAKESKVDGAEDTE